MKKIISIVLTLIMTISCFAIVGSADDFFYGDVDGDNKITVSDARYCLRAAIGLDNLDFTTREGCACDISRDGEITVEDARLILRIAVGLEELCDTSKMPKTKDEIMNFYKRAATKVANGEAGYTKKEYQTVGDLSITGVSVADSAIKKVISGIITEEDAAEEQVSTKGSNEAISRWDANCTLTDYGFIKSATCVAAGSNYKITLVTNSDDTPKRSGSTISRISQSVLYWEDVESTLADYSSIVKEYSDVHIKYNSVKIEAVITPSGKFVSLNVTSNVDVVIGSAKILVATISNKTAHFDNYVEYYDFDYDSSIKGDFNNDNYVDAADAVLLNRYLRGELVSINKEADMNGDEVIDEEDSVLLYIYLANYVFD